MIKEFAMWVASVIPYRLGEDLLLANVGDSRGEDGGAARPADYVVLRFNSGTPSRDTKDRRLKMVQVLTYSPDMLASNAMAEEVYRALHLKAGITLPVVDGPTYRVNTLIAVAEPFLLDGGPDGQTGVFVHTTNYEVRIQEV